MATASTIHLVPGIEPQYPRTGPSSTEVSLTASRLLQENHDRFHIFFNASGFHNHISHHLLTLWALHATPSQIQTAYDANRGYQRPTAAIDPSVLASLANPSDFLAHLGSGKHYNVFLTFFTAEIGRQGWQSVLRRYVFGTDAVAQAMLVRLHAGILHPLIHLGFGIEFAQPAIVAEALAEAACHEAWIGPYLLAAEEEAAAATGKGEKLVNLYDEIRNDETLRAAPRWDDGSKMRDGVLGRAKERMVGYAARVRVGAGEEELAARTAEMVNAVAYVTAGAQRRDRAVKFDFFLMHVLNASIFSSAFVRQTWLSEAEKARLLEWKIRMDLLLYAAQGAPLTRFDEIRDYRPKQPSGLDGVERRACALSHDDGHAAKLVRAIANGQRICEQHEADDAFRLKGEDWLQLGHMAIDSVEGPGDTWIRGAGFDEAWSSVPAKL